MIAGLTAILEIKENERAVFALTIIDISFSIQIISQIKMNINLNKILKG